MDPKVCILLSTYNGEAFIIPQIESLIRQSYKNWHLFIRDDCSKDNTYKILENYAKSEKRITLISDKKNIGVTKSFLTLLENANGDFYMFCDQDDVWDENKIKEMVITMCSNNNDIPLLASCDLRLVDSNLNVLSQSMRKAHHIDKLSHEKWGLIVAPMFPGCSMIFNNAAKKLALNNAYKFHLHDLQVSYSVFKNGGTIISMDKVLMSYRQHDNNVLGAKIGDNYWKSKISKLFIVLHNNKKHMKLLKGYLNIPCYKFIFYKVKHYFIEKS